MAKKSRNTLKGYFETGKKPTEGQYNNLIDSHVLLSGENTGSFLLLGDTNITGDITSSGGFKTTALSTFGNATFSSGSFTNVTTTGNADVTGTVVADQFKGDGSQLTGVTSTVVNVSAVTASFGTGSLVVSGNLYHASSSGESSTGGSGVFNPMACASVFLNISSSWKMINSKHLQIP